MTRNRQIIVRELPTDTLRSDHFELRDAAMPAPGEGEVLMRTILMSIDAANRAWMKGATYRAGIQAGDVMPTSCIGQVVESRDPSLLGIAGKTAYHGLLDVGRPNPGETVVVSAPAGSVGMFVGQIASAVGCRIVGIAGGPDKCRWVTDTLGFDDCVDHRRGDFHQALRHACPAGIDVYFDNVGGTILETALFLMNERGRIVCCGSVSQYDTADPGGPRNVPGLIVTKRLRMEGFIVMDFAAEQDKALRALADWHSQGQIVIAEDIVDGLEAAPAALIGLLAGDNRGKRLVRVAPDP